MNNLEIFSRINANAENSKEDYQPIQSEEKQNVYLGVYLGVSQGSGRKKCTLSFTQAPFKQKSADFVEFFLKSIAGFNDYIIKSIKTITILHYS